ATTDGCISCAENSGASITWATPHGSMDPWWDAELSRVPGRPSTLSSPGETSAATLTRWQKQQSCLPRANTDPLSCRSHRRSRRTSVHAETSRAVAGQPRSKGGDDPDRSELRSSIATESNFLYSILLARPASELLTLVPSRRKAEV